MSSPRTQDHTPLPVLEPLERRLLLAGSIINLTPADDWFSVLNGEGLAPGDEVILAEGVYSDSRRLVMSHVGTEVDPILVRAGDGAAVTLTRPDASQNVVNIHGAQYLILQGLEITGGSTGIRIGDGDVGRMAVYVTIEYCHVHHTDGNAITANYVGDVNVGHIFRYNEIDHTGGHGEGFYLGSNNDVQGQTTGVFRDGLIEGNYIHHLDGPTVSQGDGIEIKDGSYNNIVRDNVIHDTNYPGIIVYGTDGNPENIIEGNVIWNAGDHGIQAASEAIIRNNIILSQAASGISSQNHQSAIPGNLTILHNTIFSQGSGHAINVSWPSGDALSGPIVIANNALYPQGTGRPMNLANLPGYTISGDVGVGSPYPSQPLSAFHPGGDPNLDFGDVANKEVFPIPGSALIAAGDPAYVLPTDFNYTARGGVADVGAYAYDPNGNPGWQIVPGFKDVSEPHPVVQLFAPDDQAAEAGQDVGRFTVSRDQTAGDLVVHYAVSGTASQADYVESLTGQVTIPDGQSSADITITPVDDAETENDETVTLTLSADPAYQVGLPDSGTVTIVDDDTGGPTDDLAASETPVAGTVGGSFADTHTSNNVYESITETHSGGKPSKRYSHLEHQWTFDVAGGGNVTFHVQAHQTASSDGDSFLFQYSTDATGWTDMVIVTKAADDDAYQTYALPDSLSGTVYVRVIDTDNTQGNNVYDTIYVDHMFIRSEDGGPSLPTVSISATDSDAAEQSQDVGVFTVSRSDTSGDLIVYYNVGGTASSGDYVEALSGSVTIPDGSASAEITVTPVDDTETEGDETVVLILTADSSYNLGSQSSDTVTIADNDAGPVDEPASGEDAVAGTVSGSSLDTTASDNVYESITERISGGKPSKRHSYLEHQWTFNVTGGDSVTFHVQAHQGPSGDGDNFAFQYSTDGVNWTTMLTVTKTSDDDTYQTCALPSVLSGTVYVRAIDTDRASGNQSLDTLYVDDMFIRSE